MSCCCCCCWCCCCWFYCALPFKIQWRRLSKHDDVSNSALSEPEFYKRQHHYDVLPEVATSELRQSLTAADPRLTARVSCRTEQNKCLGRFACAVFWVLVLWSCVVGPHAVVMSGVEWSAATYSQNVGFVSELGEGVLTWLDAKPGEKVRTHRERTPPTILQKCVQNSLQLRT